MNDDRMDDRLKKEQGVARRARAMDDRQVTENRAVTDDERLEMFRMQMHNDALPDLPPIPGYHVCWLTTTNPRDPIQRRTQLGYEPVRPEDAPGLEFATQKTGEWVEKPRRLMDYISYTWNIRPFIKFLKIRFQSMI